MSTVRQITSEADLERYSQWVRTQPQGNLWQSLERKRYIETTGKEVRIYIEENGDIVGSALVVVDKTSFGLSTWEIPRGPVGNPEPLLRHILDDAKQSGCMALYCSPVEGINDANISSSASSRHIHCEATRIIDLTLSEDDVLKQMKPKGRYNIRVAQKHDVEIRESDDIEAFYSIVKETGHRDNFSILSEEKYAKFLQEIPHAFLLLAYKKKKPIAGLLGVVWNGRGIYYYGCSSYAHRASMAPYLLQWEAMRFCKRNGCTSYDLLGIAPPDAPKDHPWSGITNFKEKFSGEVVTYPPEQQIILRPVMHRLLSLKRSLLG